jgi:hypothetical protein
MRFFSCNVCGHALYLQNVECSGCGHPVGFAPDSLEFMAFDPVGNGDWCRKPGLLSTSSATRIRGSVRRLTRSSGRRRPPTGSHWCAITCGIKRARAEGSAARHPMPAHNRCPRLRGPRGRRGMQCPPAEPACFRDLTGMVDRLGLIHARRSGGSHENCSKQPVR